jgi:hypothetical protein
MERAKLSSARSGQMDGEDLPSPRNVTSRVEMFCCSRERRIFVQIRIIADSLNYKTGEVVHQAISFHLKAQDIQFWILSILIPFLRIFHDRVGGCDDAVMGNDFSTGFA